MYATACPLDRELDGDDLIPNFTSNIGRFSGALLELDSKRQVRFVHLSAFEFFTEVRQSDLIRISEDRLAFVEFADSHRLLASICLSYLYLTVYHGPLSGSKRRVADVLEQVKKYPLLNYASEFWSFHVVDYLDHTAGFPANEKDQLLMGLASKFLSDGQAVMTWIEACWMFGRPPCIRYGLEDPSLDFYGIDSLPKGSAQNAPKDFALRSLSRLAIDLRELNTSWAHVLSVEPNEIWEPSISAFTTSQFWNRVSGSTITSFSGIMGDNLTSVCLKSRISPDGKRMAVVRMYFDRG
jgi:hypothetical protein